MENLEIHLVCSKELILKTPIIKQYHKSGSAVVLNIGSARDEQDNNDIQVNSRTSSAVLLFDDAFIQELCKLKFVVSE